MKHILIFISFFLVISFTAEAQITQAYGSLIFEDSISLRPQSNLFVIPDSATIILEIGMPDKLFFDAAHSSDYAIMTDTNNYYSSGYNDNFIISIPYPQSGTVCLCLG